MVPIDYIKECLSYDSETGLFLWLKRPDNHFSPNQVQHGHNKHRAGTEAGSIKNGYKSITITYQCKRYKYYAHRLAWFIYYGEWPKNQIDHINGVRTDNRIKNLRSVTVSENRKNAKLRIDNKSGRVGVC